MKTIYKFPLKITDIQKVSMPKDSTILTVQVQRKIPCLWALVETDKQAEERSFRIITTGHPILNNIIRYIGTFQVLESDYVGHVFEIKQEKEHIR